MSELTDPEARPPTEAITADRRRAAARYLEFGDAELQKRFITAAERAHAALVGSDSWGTTAQIEAEPERRSWAAKLRRPRRETAATTVVSTPALAMVNEIATNAPAELTASDHSCRAARDVALVMAGVTSELVGDLAALPLEQQAAHSAYRQTLRLAAELEALRGIGLTHNGSDGEPCVRVRELEHLDRRIEDLEVAEVRSVLLQLSRATPTA